MSHDGRTVRCPMCGRRTTWRENPHRPFCSERCRLADLEGWLAGRYVVAGDPEESATPPAESDLPEGQSAPELREKT
jgi:endogenous inhibitor of DNA gyrase (YacG/DUF329 family)